MEPTASNFAAYMFPMAIYSTTRPDSHHDAELDDDYSISIQASAGGANHTNRIRWTIDGGEADGTQFFAIPDFARGKVPVRIDVYILDADLHSPQLRQTLDSNSSMLLDSRSVGASPLATHISAALEHWSSNYEGFEDEYTKLPFGSKIVIENLAANIENMIVHLIPSTAVEGQMLSRKQLDNLWHLPSAKWPSMMDINSLQLISQPFPTISLVHLKGHESLTYVFKSLPDDLKYFYYKTHVLLALERHPNIIGPLHYLVTKKARFGGKLGICGFILPYHPAGTLRDRLSQSSTCVPDFGDQVRWARQMTSALVHIHSSSAHFYTNLKLNNIVMSADDDGLLNTMLIDFEPRLGPSSWSPPEVHYLSYLEYLAGFSPLHEQRSRYTQLMQALVPGWKKQNKSSRYQNTPESYCVPWFVLTKRQQEAAQVFMLGKLLWCIFERTHTLNTVITIDTFREDEADIAFPTFRYTPEPMRRFIKDCTSGAMEWEDRHFPVVRCGNRMIRRGSDRSNATAGEVVEAMTEWWGEEVKRAEVFCNALIDQRNKDSGGELDVTDSTLAAMRQRPTLLMVEFALKSLVTPMTDG